MFIIGLKIIKIRDTILNSFINFLNLSFYMSASLPTLNVNKFSSPGAYPLYTEQKKEELDPLTFFLSDKFIDTSERDSPEFIALCDEAIEHLRNENRMLNQKYKWRYLIKK